MASLQKAIRGMTPREARLVGLAKGEHPLSRWYGDPLDRPHAETLLKQAQYRLNKSLRARRSCVMCRLNASIARYWLGRPIDRDYGLLVKVTSGTRHGQALTELVYGQLLISCKLIGGMQHLTRGFELARDLLDPEDFFRVRKRHRLLSRLVLGDTPGPSATLVELLTEAAVIGQLESSVVSWAQPVGDRTDTLG